MKLSPPGSREEENRGQSLHEGVGMVGCAVTLFLENNCYVISWVCYDDMNVHRIFFHRFLIEVSTYQNKVNSLCSWSSLLRLCTDGMFLVWVSATNHRIWAGFQGGLLPFSLPVPSGVLWRDTRALEAWGQCSVWGMVCPCDPSSPCVLEGGYVAVEWGEVLFHNPECHQKENQINLKKTHRHFNYTLHLENPSSPSC